MNFWLISKCCAADVYPRIALQWIESVKIFTSNPLWLSVVELQEIQLFSSEFVFQLNRQKDIDHKVYIGNLFIFHLYKDIRCFSLRMKTFHFSSFWKVFFQNHYQIVSMSHLLQPKADSAVFYFNIYCFVFTLWLWFSYWDKKQFFVLPISIGNNNSSQTDLLVAYCVAPPNLIDFIQIETYSDCFAILFKYAHNLSNVRSWRFY